MNQALQSKLASLPQDSGAYLMKNSRGKVIYVGKAKSLKSRVSSYFGAHAQQNPKTRALAREIYDFEIIITQTEVEALLLERTLIKHHKPVYNILLRDDKEYPFLRIDFEEDWPRIEKVRRRKDDGATYLGPFGSAGQLKIMLDATYRIFPLIRCSRHEFETTKRPCNYYHMKMCLGPCHIPVVREHYVTMMKNALNFLQGRNREMATALKKKMKEAAGSEQYEYAALLRDQLTAYERVTERQTAVIEDADDLDVIGFQNKGTRASLHVLMVRDHLLISSDGFVLENRVQNRDEALRDFLLQYYESRSTPREILVPFLPADCEQLKLALLSNHPELSGLRIHAPARGPLVDLVATANKNASYKLEEQNRLGEQRRVELQVVRDKLGLRRLPRRIECLDISNTQDTAVVAAIVTFVDGKAAKDQYRKYSIQSTDGQDDFGAIREVVRRRLDRGVRECDLPDLLVIDGGRGQLNAAHDIFADFPGMETELISLAKSRTQKNKKRFIASENPERSYERVFFPDRDTPIPLGPGTPEYRVLTQIRDEAHRFAISYHRKKRAKLAQSSELEAIPGIGPTMRQKLLAHFSGLDGIKGATLEQLRRVKGLREASAVALYSQFHNSEETDE